MTDGSMPTSMPNLAAQAQQAHRAGDTVRADALYRAILARHPDNYDALAALGTLCFQIGRLGDAEQLMSRALSVRPTAVDMLANLGVVLLALGRSAEALQRCDQALARLPDHPAIHYNRANALRALGRLDQALTSYQAALARNPDYAEAHDNRGVTLALLARWPEALVAHEQALARRPEFAEAHYNKGIALAALGRYEEAAAAQEAALRLRPALAEAWYNLGVARSRLRRFDAALDALNQSLALRPQFAEAHNGRALVLFDLERFADADAALNQALALRPDYGAAMQLRGLVQLRLGKADEACRLLLSAMHLPGVDERALLQVLGRSLTAVASAQGVLRRIQDDAAAASASKSFRRHNNLPCLTGEPPLVSIVAPCFNHAAYVGTAIASVRDQTYPNIEFIVIDDGSSDGSIAAIQQALADFPFPHKFVHRENRGAHATINEGLTLATGRYVSILNTDDLYAPERIDCLVRAVQADGHRWGFSNVDYLDAAGRILRYGEHPRADSFMQLQDQLYDAPSLSNALTSHNFAISTGNLFFERTLWEEIGGFESLRYNHDWAFCLAAILRAEPSYVDLPLYRYRLHESNTITERPTGARDEADALLTRWQDQASSGITNPVLARTLANIRDIDFAAMAEGFGHVVKRSRLLAYAGELGF